MTFHYLETLIDFVVEMMHSNSKTASLNLMINNFVTDSFDQDTLFSPYCLDSIQ